MRSFKFLVCLLFCIAGYAFSEDAQKSTSGMYYEASLGGSYFNFDVPMCKFTGFGPTVNLKAGGSFEMMVGYLVLEYSRAFGTNEKFNVEFDASGYRVFLGLGLSWYPFDKGVSLMHGSFVGMSVGIMLLAADKDGQNMGDTFEAGSVSDVEEQGFSAAFELGKLWSVSEKVDAGIALTAAFDAPIRFGEGKYETSVYSLGASLRFAMR